MNHMLGSINGYLCKKKRLIVGKCDNSVVLESM